MRRCNCRLRNSSLDHGQYDYASPQRIKILLFVGVYVDSNESMKGRSTDLLLWLFTILSVPAIIIVTFWLNGYLGIRL